MVGESNDPQDVNLFAFLYDDGVMTDLNALIDPALGWTLQQAVGINDSGQIAAYGCRGEVCDALLLDGAPGAAPVPEPGAWWLLSAGLVLLAWRQRSMSMCMMPSSSYGADEVTKPKLL